MHDESEEIPVEVEAEIGALISELREAGWKVSASCYDAKVFGNWYVDIHRADYMIRLVKDRSQYMSLYMIDGPPEEIRTAGLWKAFNNLQEFRYAVIKWVANAGSAFDPATPSKPN